MTGFRGAHDVRVMHERVGASPIAAPSNLFRVLIEHTSDIVTVVAEDGTITYQSPSCRRVLGQEPEDLVGTSSFDLIHPEDLPWARAMFTEHIAIEGATSPARIRCRHRNGSWVWLEAVGNNLLNQPEVAGMVVVSRDISAQVRAEQALQENIKKAFGAQRKTAALLEIAKIISASPDLDQLLSAVQEWIASTLPCDVVATYCRDLADGMIRLHGQRGLSSAAHAARRGALPWDTRFDACIARGETLILNDFDREGWAPEDAHPGHDLQALAMIPLRVRGHGLGALVLVRTASGFTDDDMELCQGVAGQLAIAIERAQLDRCREAEAQVMAAIARVGQELISCLDTPALVERLCRVTTEVLRCDFCETRFWDPTRDAFVLVAEFGVTSEEHEALRSVTIPRHMLPLEAKEVWHGTIDEIESEQLSGLGRAYGVTGVVIIPLRRGNELIGIQTAAFRHREARFSGPQLQIARAIGQLAPMALENARLVEELQRASRLKSEFVATMSHELRTPLNVIIGYSDLLIEESFGPLSAEQRQACRRVERSAEELLELINATLDLGRLESGRLPLDLQEVSLPALATLVASETSELSAKPNVTVQWRVSDDLPLVRTDPLKVKVILKNLIANAIKFTPAGEVEVSIFAHGSGVQLSVRDTGIGIAPETEAIIFEPFRQADGSMSRRFGGVGLGLHIVRRLTEALGGTVTVTSKVGHGSTFRVYLSAAGPQSSPK